MSIKFILSIVLLVSFYIIFIIVSIILKLCIKSINKKATKIIKFAIEKNQRERVNIIKIDMLLQCSSIVSIAFIVDKLKSYQMLRFIVLDVEKINFRFIFKIDLEKISKTLK